MSISPIKKNCLTTLVPVLLFTGSAFSQDMETRYFRDVTVTHLPSDPEAHPLDVALTDVDQDGDLDAILALEGMPNRLYLNDGTGKFTWRRAFLRRSGTIPNMYVLLILIRTDTWT